MINTIYGSNIEASVYNFTKDTLSYFQVFENETILSTVSVVAVITTK